MGNCRHRIDFTSWLVYPKCSYLHCVRYEFFIELCNIVVYNRANYFFLSSDSGFGHFTQGGISLNSETMKRNGGSGSSPWGGQISPLSKPGGCRRIPYIGLERKNSVRKAGERYKHREEKSGSVVLRPVEILHLYRMWRIPLAYSCSNTSSWPMSR